MTCVAMATDSRAYFVHNEYVNNQESSAGQGNELRGLWNPEVQRLIYKGSPVIHIPSRINRIHHIGTYLFKLYCNCFLPSIRRTS